MADTRINVNTASRDDLANAAIAELDDDRASDIVSERDAHGAFRDWNDLKRRVPGFSDGMIQNLQEAGATLG